VNGKPLCDPTADTAGGSTCALSTTVDSVVPGLAREGMRGVLELGGVEFFDGGSDGEVDTGPNTRFAVPGIFVS
jgi:hypothetical protein